MTALDDLISAVEAGAISADLIQNVFGNGWDDVRALAAFDGSLDAAKSLHDALLPEFVARPQIGGQGAGVQYWHCIVEDWDTGEEFSGDNMPCPARAWLLAILRAKRAMGE